MNKPLNQSLLIAFALFSATLSVTATAQTAYVSDQLEITMRTGPAVKNKITKMLKSGDSVEVIQENSNGYTEVKTTDGRTGWVLKRYLMDAPSARTRLQEVEAREQALQAQQLEIDTLRAKAGSSAEYAQSLELSNAGLKEELQKVRQVAADTLAINEKNKALSVELKQAKSMQTSLQLENERLKGNTEQAWFLRGAGVILLGMFLGLLIPKLRFKKKRRWGEYN